MFIKEIIFLILFIFPGFSFAGSQEGIPWSFVFFQTLNFSIFVACLCYLLIKKIPPILKQKQMDFLDYRKRAISMEEKGRLEYIKLEKENLVLEEKEKNIQSTARTALADLKLEKQKEYELWLQNIEKQHQLEWDRQRRNVTVSLKDWILSQVMQNTREKLKAWSKNTESHEVADQIIEKEWRIQ